jgi:AcrR family transcriptional regulator
MLWQVKYNIFMDDPKTKILKASSALFLKGGARALNVRAIAERAGISTIGIYSHFQGKQGILDALYIEGFQRVSKAMDVIKPGAEPKVSVLQACRNYLDCAEKFEAHYLLIFGHPDDDYQPSSEARDVAALAFKDLTHLAAALLPLTATPAQRQDAAIQLWSVIHGFVCLKQHTIAKAVNMRHWKARALMTLEVIVDAIQREGKREGNSASQTSQVKRSRPQTI